jgi:3-hydroxypropanoate dehydrogenase
MDDHSEALSRIFDSRARHKWSDKPVPLELIHKLYEYVRFGPTSVNSMPARFRFVMSQSGRDRLSALALGANVEKVRTAPCVCIIAYDEKWYEMMPKLMPYNADIKAVFAGNEQLAHSTAFRNSSLQGAYLMIAARLLGLDCGPMSGFNAPGVDAEFFAGTSLKSNFLCALGYANDEPHPRLPRLTFEDAAEIL